MKRLLFLASVLCCCTVAFGQVQKKSPKKSTPKKEVKLDYKTATDTDDEPPVKLTNKKEEDNFAIGAMEFSEGPREERTIITEREQKGIGDPIFEVVEQMPQFPGGQAGLMQYLSSNVKYPALAAENGVHGRVVCTFVVEKDGSTSNVKVAKGVDKTLDNEAVRVIKAMPKWIPGMHNGKNVRTKFTIPITFRLPEPEPANKQ